MRGGKRCTDVNGIVETVGLLVFFSVFSLNSEHFIFFCPDVLIRRQMYRTGKSYRHIRFSLSLKWKVYSSTEHTHTHTPHFKCYVGLWEGIFLFYCLRSVILRLLSGILEAHLAAEMDRQHVPPPLPPPLQHGPMMVKWKRAKQRVGGWLLIYPW